MAKAKTLYVCSACGGTSPKWAGQCPDCKAWNSLVESIAEAPPVNRFSGYAGAAGEQGIIELASVQLEPEQKASTGIGELDRVLGGGLVPGSVILLGGDPGIGKSTLLTQTLGLLSQQMSCLYVSGEESPRQIGLRAQRLELNCDRFHLLPETNVERMLAIASHSNPDVMVIDSIQTVYTDLLQSAPGSVAQVRESAAQLVRYAKRSGAAIVLVGHVTKEGALAGPRVLEHMVDTVLYFEGEQGSRFRLIRTIKNRYGAVNELGVFAMTDRGLREVSNPSAIFLSGHKTAVPGSVVMVTREGSRPLLLEVQALVDESRLGNPRRLCVGLEQNRLSMLLAVMHRHAGVVMYDQDVFVNVVGGVRISETAADLPVLLAVLSSLKDRPVPQGTAVFGEVGLAGEIRPVPNGPDRLREAAKHGFKRVIAPKQNLSRKDAEGIELIGVERLDEALEHAFG
ncbi:MAG: DNA repair protein RadA [Gammaproteobacteria bacterium RIFOXYA12_FULL_61_12]|nr:MAG: DNA repair protein RadA [Gammaproteobacteria bacterium RIFOXYA12_FULL_61_12]OGT91358.1 MAG: DNA repair protein RadA [Gammaproteobacteria bacterium RIFOXYD12_FULL_61_37]